MIKRGILFATLTAVFVFGYFVLKGSSPIAQKANEVLSPLPSYLVNTKLAKTLDFWQPTDSHVLSANNEKPHIQATAAYVYDIATDTVLFDQESKKRLPIASLVKIATAIVALESSKANTPIVVSSHAAS